jgi:tetratricopeptide (TPR) repeat protein
VIRCVLLRLAWLAAPLPLLAHGDLHEQIDAVSKEIAATPGNGALFLRRAELHRAHEDWAPAMADYARAEQLKADDSIIRLGRGKLFLATGEPAKACLELDPLIEKSPAHVDARATRARARVKNGEHAGAVADYSAAIDSATRPEPEHYLERAAALIATDPPRLTEALKGLDEGIARLGSPVTLVLAAVDIEIRMRHFDAALGRIDRAGAGAKRPEQWLVRRAEVLELASRPAEARAAWAQALAALEALPPRHRNVQATVDLEKRIRQHLTTASP